MVRSFVLTVALFVCVFGFINPQLAHAQSQGQLLCTNNVHDVNSSGQPRWPADNKTWYCVVDSVPFGGFNFQWEHPSFMKQLNIVGLPDDEKIFQCDDTKLQPQWDGFGQHLQQISREGTVNVQYSYTIPGWQTVTYNQSEIVLCVGPKPSGTVVWIWETIPRLSGPPDDYFCALTWSVGGWCGGIPFPPYWDWDWDYEVQP